MIKRILKRVAKKIVTSAEDDPKLAAAEDAADLARVPRPTHLRKVKKRRKPGPNGWTS